MAKCTICGNKIAELFLGKLKGTIIKKEGKRLLKVKKEGKKARKYDLQDSSKENDFASK